MKLIPFLFTQKIYSKQLFELGKFFFTAGTATLAFLVAAEKVNAPSEWKDPLVLACYLLLAATILATAMVIKAAPHSATREDVATWPTGTIVLWFGLWVAGSIVGLRAVLPTPPTPS